MAATEKAAETASRRSAFTVTSFLSVAGARLRRSRQAGGRLAEGGACRVPGMDITPEVGTTARRSRTVTAEDISLFTRLTGDRNPLHHDEDLARASRFGGVVVQGGVTSGLLNAVVAEQLPGPGSVFLEVAWRFLAPVRPGDVITAHAVVTSAREDKPVTGLRTTVTNQDGTPVLDGTAVVWRDPVVAAAVPVPLADQPNPMPEEPAPALEDS